MIKNRDEKIAHYDIHLPLNAYMCFRFYEVNLSTVTEDEYGLIAILWSKPMGIHDSIS